MSNTKTHSLLKAISWRIVATTTTVVLIIAFTNEPTVAVTIGGAEVFAKLILYYLHERIWNL